MKNDKFYTYLANLSYLLGMANNEIKKLTNLSGLEAKLLNQIRSNNNRASASVLAKFNNVTIAAIMHCLQVIEEKGYLVKEVNDDDNRTKNYVLTESGLKQVKIATRIFERVTNKYIDYLGPDMPAFERIMEKTINFIKEEEKNND